MIQRAFLRHRTLVAAWVLLAACLWIDWPARADDPPSVEVKTQTPVRGELPRLVTAYGATEAAPDAVTSISVQYDGQVADLLVTAGQTVHAGDPLVRVVPAASVLSAADQARTALRLAQAELEHATQMREQQLATRDQLAQARKAATDAQTQVDTFQRQGIDTAAEPLPAPFDGTIRSVAVAQGDRVQANAALLTIVRAGGVVLAAGVEPAERSLVAPNEAVKMTTMSDGGASFPGKVESVGGQVDPKTRLVEVRIVRTDGQPLFENQDLRAAITVQQVTGWKLPRPAVLTDDQGAYAFQVDDGKAKRVNLRVLVDAGDTMLVDGALDPALKLVTDGAYQLSDGMAVR
jgi:membrane fusion protein (multidrug efflux system)